jgi:catechol 2,3-dioxygenase
MDTLPLDVAGVLEQADPDRGPMDGQTRMGHVHLNVADIAESDRFYCGLLGFGATVRGYPGALFVAAGGYHHHLGLNTWAGAGAPPPPPGSRGLARFEVVVPRGEELAAIAGRLDDAGVALDRVNGTVEVSDPSSNRVAIRAGA